MPYKSHPGSYRRYPASDSAANQKAVPTDKNLESLEAVSIPLPNVTEDATASHKVPAQSRNNPFLNFIRERIELEDIILIALVILLINEGIEDEMLILLLIYIFLT